MITHLKGKGTIPELVYRTRDEQIELLSFVLANDSEHEMYEEVKVTSPTR